MSSKKIQNTQEENQLKSSHKIPIQTDDSTKHATLGELNEFFSDNIDTMGYSFDELKNDLDSGKQITLSKGEDNIEINVSDNLDNLANRIDSANVSDYIRISATKVKSSDITASNVRSEVQTTSDIANAYISIIIPKNRDFIGYVLRENATTGEVIVKIPLTDFAKSFEKDLTIDGQTTTYSIYEQRDSHSISANELVKPQLTAEVELNVELPDESITFNKLAGKLPVSDASKIEDIEQRIHDLEVLSGNATGFSDVNQNGSEGGIAPAQSLIYNISDIPGITWSYRQLYGGTDTHMLVRTPINKTVLGYRIQFSPDVSHVGALNVALSSFPILTTDENYEYRLLKGKSEHTEAFLQIASNIDTLGKTVFHGSLKNALLTSENAGLHLGISQNNGESYSIHNPTLSDRGDWNKDAYYSYGAIVKHNHKHYLLNKLSTIATAIRHSDSPSEPGTTAGTNAGWIEWNSATTDIGIINSIESNIHGSQNQIDVKRVNDELDIGFDSEFTNHIADLTSKTGAIITHSSNNFGRVADNTIAGWISASKFNASVIDLQQMRTITGWQNSKTIGNSNNANAIRVKKTIDSNQFRVLYDDGDVSDPHYAVLNRGDTTHFIYVGEDTTWNYWLLYTRFSSMEFEVQRNEGLVARWEGEYDQEKLYTILKKIFPNRTHNDNNHTIS